METFLIGMADFQAQVLISATYLGKKNNNNRNSTENNMRSMAKKKEVSHHNTLTELISPDGFFFSVIASLM